MKILKTYNQIFEGYKLSDLSVGDYVILKAPDHIPGFSENQYKVSKYFFSHNVGVITGFDGGDIFVKFYNEPSVISTYLFNEKHEVTAELSDILYHDTDSDKLIRSLSILEKEKKFNL